MNTIDDSPLAAGDPLKSASALITLKDRIENLERELAERDRRLAVWMIANDFATGHGDTMDDLLKELSWQVKELRGR